jgi:predicted lipid-binding transport protein (Tim44 family)
MRIRQKNKTARKTTGKKQAKAGLLRGLATAALVGSVRASAGRSGVAGMAGAFVFERMLRRFPLGALVVGAGLVGRDLYRAGRKARDTRQAHHAQEQGMASPPPEPEPPLNRSAPRR